MKCPKCKGDTVVDQLRLLVDNIEKRWRKCKSCNHIFETYEFNANDVRDLIEEREIDPKYVSNSLCWQCSRATGFCPWSRDFEPVQGWEAVKTTIKNQGGELDSYDVKSCPLFEKDERR